MNPDQIKRFSGREGVAWSKKHIGSVRSGSWDIKVTSTMQNNPLRKRTEYFEDYIVYESLEDHFINDVPWEETALVTIVREEIERGNRCWGSTSQNDVSKRCQRLDRLYKQIKRQGYQTKQELLGIETKSGICRLDSDVDRYGSSDHITRTGHHPVRGFRSIKANEIMVDIGRNGEILFVDGRHRLAIAKLLELDRIPVIVTVRHREWVEKIASGDLDGVESHPDIEAMENE